uniref:Putative zinc finger CCCH domain-containing protein 6 n=1 Tax=Davidia involucrata TaxID=16924 RepID=A0A5B6YIN0_DAVIN
MRGLQKSKRVSWASDVNLCQVRLFLSEESPSQVGLGAQDHLQAKTSWPPHSTGLGSDDNLPPGFEGAHPENLLKNKLSQIPLIKWRCPPRFVLDFTWQVVAGEESKEVEVQNQRELRVLEAVYPRASAIPPNPSVLTGIEDSHHHNQRTPLIPITPIEDEDTAADTSFDSMAPNTIAMISQPLQLAPGILPASQCSATYPNPPANGNPVAGMALGVEPSVAAAAYTALTAVMTSNDQENLIDRDLLIKILRDPKVVEKLITDHGAATNPQIIPKPRSSGVTLSDPLPVHINRTEAGAPLLATPFYSPANMVGPASKPRTPLPEVVSVPSPPVGAPVAKDINYYKSLIQQHGGERQEILPQFGSRSNHQLVANLESVNNPRPMDLKPKIMKPCIYFNSSRGCRHGANCSYQHDAPSQQRVSSMQEQSTKRMKMDREITGT